jgi:hypothetical protein
MLKACEQASAQISDPDPTPEGIIEIFNLNQTPAALK